MGRYTRRMRRQKRMEGQAIALKNPESDDFEEHVRKNAPFCERVIQPASHANQSLAICGAGPSLADTAAEWTPKTDCVWGTNSAAIWLYDNGYPVTHAFTVDQTPEMVEEWKSAPPLEYYLASTVNPELTAHLLAHGRRITWFHNFVGIRGPMMDGQPYEYWLYEQKYPTTVRVGSALNATTRAIDLACHMGFRPIYVLGADCALKVLRPRPDVPFDSDEHLRWLEEDVVMHADGSSPLRSGATKVTLNGEIDGRQWESKADLWVTAVWLVQMARAIPHLHLIGDTLPNALMQKPDSYLDDMPHLISPDGTPHNFKIEDQTAYWPGIFLP